MVALTTRSSDAGIRRPHEIAKSIFGALALALLLTTHIAVAKVRAEPGVFDVEVRSVKIGMRHLHITYVRPAMPSHPKYLLVFTTGDGGWHGVSNEVIEHLGQEGYSIAGMSAPDILRPLKKAGRKLSAAQASELLGAAFERFKKDLGAGPQTRLIVVGFSRGATFVAFTAVHPELHADLAGAIAMGLTREADYLGAIEPSVRESNVQRRRRVLIYPALKLFAKVRVAVIQSTGDNYVRAAESRQLLGPDTATRRLYTVDARNHRFAGGREQMLEDLDAALRWIEQPSGSPRSAVRGRRLSKSSPQHTVRHY